MARNSTDADQTFTTGAFRPRKLPISPHNDGGMTPQSGVELLDLLNRLTT